MARSDFPKLRSLTPDSNPREDLTNLDEREHYGRYGSSPTNVLQM
jgi:hypothetical protein